MDYVFFVLGLVAAVPAYTYASWLNKQNNKAGAIWMWTMVLLGIGLAVFSMLRY